MVVEVFDVTSRTRLDWLVFDEIWTNLKNHVDQEYGQIDGYLSRAVETAMREAIDEHRYARVEEKVQRLVETFDAKKTEDENSSFSPSEYSGKTRATVYVDKSLLARYKEFVDNSQYCYGVKLSHTLYYYLQGGRPASVAGQLDRVIEEIKREQDDSMSTTDEIVDRLGERFSRGEFLEAADAAGVGTKKYALEQYLPKILDRMDVYPHPGKPELFIPRESATIPETPDPGTLPYQTMDDGDKRLALKAGALRAAGESSSGYAKFTVADAVDVLDGRPRHSTVRPLLREIAAESTENGFVFDDDVPGLRVDRTEACAADYDNEAALEIVGWLADTTTPEETSEDSATSASKQPADDWVADAVDALEDLPEKALTNDSVIDNKIARAKHPDRFGDDVTADDIPDPGDLVADGDRERVLERLGIDTDSDSDTDSSVATEPEQPADRRDEARQQMDALLSAQPVADGGTPVDDRHLSDRD